MILLRAYSCSSKCPRSPVKCCSLRFKWNLNPFAISQATFNTHGGAYLLLNAQNYYEILGVKSSCSQKEIRTAFLELAKKYHPDKNLNADVKGSNFQQIKEAYDCLSNVSDRSRYDYELREHGTGSHPPSWQYQRSSRAPPPRHYQEYYQNFTYMHHGQRYKRPTDGPVRDPQMFGTAITALTISCLVVVIILQAYSQSLDIEICKINTEMRFEALCKIYNQSYLYRDNSIRNGKRKNAELFQVMEEAEEDGAQKMDYTADTAKQQ